MLRKVHTPATSSPPSHPFPNIQSRHPPYFVNVHCVCRAVCFDMHTRCWSNFLARDGNVHVNEAARGKQCILIVLKVFSLARYRC